MMTSFSFDPERIGIASNLFQPRKTAKLFSTFLPALPVPPVSAGCISSSPRRNPAPGSSPPRRRLPRSFPQRLPTPLSSSTPAHILFTCSTSDPPPHPPPPPP